MSQKQVNSVKRELLAAQISYKRSEYNEKSLYADLHNFFLNLKQKVLKELEEYYNSEFMFQGQVDLILSPIFESQRQYYNIILKHIKKEYGFGRAEGKRLVHNALQQHKKKNYHIKAEKSEKLPVSSLIKKDELFGTSEFSRQQLINQSFIASENTMNRVDQQINQILADGYKDGWGYNEVAKDITRRFDQLSDWESRRIARTEIHNAHNMGIMNTYEEMGVEYTQWVAARDARTRTSHRKINGEIIPLGGTYSNDLRYPGDTTGPLKEWINCRCSNAPFIIPDGYMAPSFSPFRESDLIQTLDYWNQEELITQATQESNSQLYSENYGVPLDHSLSKAKFAVPTEDLSEFGITDKGLEVIHGFQKKRFGADKEYGFAFNEKTGKILTKEYRGVENDVIIKPPKGKYSTIHYHTEDGFNPVSHGDIEDFLKKKHERVGINVSKKETWLITQEHKFTPQEINKITKDIKRFEDNQLKKMSNDFKKRQRKIGNIKDPKKRKAAKKEFDDYLNNEFIDKHNKELGDNILNYTSKIKGLKVKRVMNTPIQRDSVKSLPKLKVDKKYDLYAKNIKHSNPINSKKKGYDKFKNVKIDPNIKNNKKVKVDSIDTYSSYSDNAKEKIDSYVKSQNLKNKDKSKLAIWSGTGAKSIKAFQLKDMDVIKKEFRKKGRFFDNIHDVSRITYQIKRIINKRGNELGENLIVYKGIKSEDIDLSKFVVGEVNKFDTHMSTTLNLDTAKKFAKDLNDEGYIVVMYTYKKVKGAAINGSFNNAPEEYEILLSESQEYIPFHIDGNMIYIFVG